MKTICDISDDLIAEIFSRVPITSLSALRVTCKRWNDVSKTKVVGKKAATNQQFLEFVLMDYKVSSLRFHLQEIRNKDQMFIDSSVKKVRKLEDVVVSEVSQCDGLLLCVIKENSRLLVWNPYLGQTRWIQPIRNNLMRYKCYALGYVDNKYKRNHKILRFLYDIGEAKDNKRKYQIEVYNFSTNAWKVLNVNLDWEDPSYLTGVSLKGNTYFLGREATHSEDHLICFDFTTERFGQRLSLPFKPLYRTCATVILSCVRDEKLALLYNHYQTSERITIWISTKIESDAISWSMFFKVDRNNLPRDFPNYFVGSSFFIDEEKKVALLFRKRAYPKAHPRACIIGEDKFINYVNIGESLNNHWDFSYLVGSSYVPSLVQLKVHQPWRKRKERED